MSDQRIFFSSHFLHKKTKIFAHNIWKFSKLLGAALSEAQQDDAEENSYAAAYIQHNNLENEMLPPEACNYLAVKTTFKLYTR